MLALLIVVLSISIFSVGAWWLNPQAIQEHQSIELAQAALLLFACAMHGVRARQLKAAPAMAIVHAGFALLTFSFAVRELDISRFGEAPLWEYIQRAIQGIGLLLWGCLFVVAIKHLKIIRSELLTILKMPAMMLTILGGLFFIAGWPFDKKLVLPSVELSQLVEETLELNACVMLMLAAVVHRIIPRKTS